jgi:hypothetical protein
VTSEEGNDRVLRELDGTHLWQGAPNNGAKRAPVAPTEASAVFQETSVPVSSRRLPHLGIIRSFRRLMRGTQLTHAIRK